MPSSSLSTNRLLRNFALTGISAVLTFVLACGGTDAAPSGEESPAAAVEIGTDEQGAMAGSWEEVEGWLINLTITAQATQTFDNSNAAPGAMSGTSTFSGKFVAAVPVNYGVPGVPGMQGPNWTLLPSLGSPAILSTPLTLSVESTRTEDAKSAADCPVLDTVHRVTTTKTSGQAKASIESLSTELMAQAILQFSGDLTTYDVTAGGGGGQATVAIETVTTTGGGCGTKPETEKTDRTQTASMEIPMVTLTGLPLPSTPSPLRGSRTMPLALKLGRPFADEIPATVEWNVVPIGEKK